jgi:Na+:H+ antiporter
VADSHPGDGGCSALQFFVAALTWSGTSLAGFELPLGAALLFGALISPTDPIAVLAILRRAHVSKDIETLITGESLFNDGVGVAFTIVLGVAHGGVDGHDVASTVVKLLLREAVGGVAFGLLLGAVAYWMLKGLDNYTVEVLITLALVTGAYSLAEQLHTSGPIAMVVSGLLIGNQGRAFAMSERTREHLDTFREMTDEILNAVLFVLIGLEFLVIRFEPANLLAALSAIPLVLAARFASVGLPVLAMRVARPFRPFTVRLIWCFRRSGASWPTRCFCRWRSASRSRPWTCLPSSITAEPRGPAPSSPWRRSSPKWGMRGRHRTANARPCRPG